MITQKDVALKAQVSERTVCNYFNNPKIVRQKTKEKVEKAIKELNYKPSYIASSLSTGKTKTIGFLCSQITSSFFHPMCINCEKLLREKNYNLIICPHDNNDELEKYYLNMLYQRGVDGIITLPTANKEEYYSLNEIIPVVTFDKVKYDGIYNCSSNFEKSIEDVVDKLYKQGCRKFLYLEEEFYRTWRSDINFKLNPYIRLMKEYGIEPLVRKGYINYNEIDYGEFMNNLPHAILCENDTFAFYFMIYFIEKGIDIRKECNIIGYDNFPISNQYNISTIRQNADEISKNVVNNLLKLLNNEKIKVLKEEVDCQFIDRGTSSITY